MKVVLYILFHIFSNVKVEFLERKLIWRFYTLTKALPTIQQVQLIVKKKFAQMVLDENDEAFIVQVATFMLKITIYPTQKTLILLLIIKKVILLDKYSNYANLFLKDSVVELLKQINLNKYSINLIKVKKPLYGPINSLKLVKLETLKSYIKINLANGFIMPSKSPTSAPILFV